MKKLDLSNPVIQEGLTIITTQYESALAVYPRVEEAVLPIYAPDKSEARPEQIASGVVVKISSEYFVFSASHVFDDLGHRLLLVGVGGGRSLIPLEGERFSSAKGRSGTHCDDPIDSSVFHIASPVGVELAEVAISLEDLDLGAAVDERCVYIASGFRTKESTVFGRKAYANRGTIPSIEYGHKEYAALGLNEDFHLALAFEKRAWSGVGWQTSPTLRGVSGGAIVRVSGILVTPPFSVSASARQLLSAIVIEQRHERGGKPGAIVGTRIKVHLELIREFLPSLLEG